MPARIKFQGRKRFFPELIPELLLSTGFFCYNESRYTYLRKLVNHLNLLEFYQTYPENYILCGSGGTGKTTSLLLLERELTGAMLNNKTVIPLYFKMNVWNRKRIRGNFLLDELCAFFNEAVRTDVVCKMLRESSEYLFLFLLDGVNELVDYCLENGMMVYECLENEIRELSSFSNVNIIMTSRREFSFYDPSIQEKFKKIEFEKLEKTQIDAYLKLSPTQWVAPEIHLKEELENPMFLRLFREIYERAPEEAMRLKSRNELLQKYFELDVLADSMEAHRDNLREIRRFLIHEILPKIALEVEKALLWINVDSEENKLRTLEYQSLLEQVLSETIIPQNMTKALIYQILPKLGIVDEQLEFSHETIREYLALCAFLETKNRKEVIDLVIKNLKYYPKFDKAAQFSRRCRHLDFAEFIYGELGAELYCFLAEEDEVKKEAFEFYYELAGLHEDLSENQKCVEIGWIAVEEMQKIKLTPLEQGTCYNFLYYCCNKEKKRDAYPLLEAAIKELENVPQYQKKQEEYKLTYGKIISNMGSYYYERKEYEEALKWHKKALEFRKISLPDRVMDSYRTIMSDYFCMKQYEKGYETYREAVKKTQPDALFLVRAIGCELCLLKEKKEENLEKQILEELPVQIERVVELAVSNRRMNVGVLKDLQKKLEELEVWTELQELVKEYRTKIEEYL